MNLFTLRMGVCRSFSRVKHVNFLSACVTAFSGRCYDLAPSGLGSFKFYPLDTFNNLEDDGPASFLITETVPETVKILANVSTPKS